MHHILHQNFINYFALSPDRIDYPIMSAQQLEKFIKSCKINVKGVGGHMIVPYTGYESVVKEPIFYFTFLRNPADRYLSFLNHRINRMKFDWDLEHFMGIDQFYNLQTRKLAGEENLQKAIDNIEAKVDFVGFMNKFDESLVLLKDKMNFTDFNIRYQKSNVLVKPKIRYSYKELNQKEQDRVNENNQLDIQLYDYVENNIYPRYINEYKGNFEEDLEKHSKENQNHKFSKLRLNIDRAKNFGIRKLIFKKKIFH
jgi:hypothetical protein